MCPYHGGMGTDLILLTAAVVPDAAFRNALSDPDERLRQYRGAIQQWSVVAGSTRSRLLVVETSGSAGHLADLADVVSFTPSEVAKKAGKGGAESEALEAGVRAAGLGADDTFHKVTGRLALRNAAAVIKPVQGGACVRRRMDRSYVDVRFFSAKAGVWNQYLLGMGAEVDDGGGRYLEHVMAQRLIVAEYDGVEVERFAERPMFAGSSGTSGKKYGSAKDRLMSPVMLKAENVLASVGAVKHL